MNFKCYSSEELITLNTLHEVVQPGTYFTAESTEAMRIKSLAHGENILMLGIEPSTFASKIDILTTTPIVHNIMLYIVLAYLMLFAALTTAVCLYNASFFAIDFCKCHLFSCFVFVY